MREWTNEARAELQQYLERIRTLCAGKDADETAELIDNLRDYLSREAEDLTTETVDVVAIQAAIGKAGPPEEVASGEVGMAGDASVERAAPTPAAEGEACGAPVVPQVPSGAAVAPLPQWRVTHWYEGGAFLWLFCILLPAAAILVEALTHLCADFYLDPLPSWWHLLGLLPVPVIVVWTARALRQGQPPARGLFFANGYLLVVSLAYALLLFPLLPTATLGILALGLGLLGYAPYFTTLVAFAQAGALAKRNVPPLRQPGLYRWWLAGAALAATVYGGWEARQALVADAAKKAIAGTPEQQENGLRLIRLLNGEDQVLRHCHGLFRTAPMFMGDRRGDDRGEYQKLYFRLTGRDYRLEPIPSRLLSFGKQEHDFFPSRGLPRDWEQAWAEDMVAANETGGAAVGTRVRSLFLQSSAQDLSIAASAANAAGGDGADAGPSVAYVEWTMEFLNRSSQDREARGQIILPPGGVASRLTLWIDGEEREAAFGGRAQVREAYRQVAVVRRRDPALLTTAGPDRVLLQCFPVRPGVPMKVKVGFSIPLYPDAGAMTLQLPYLAECNFASVEGLTHQVWAESRCRLTCAYPGLRAETVRKSASQDIAGTNAVAGAPANGAAAAQPSVFHAIRGPVAGGDLPGLVIVAPQPQPEAAVYRGELGQERATGTLRREKALPGRRIALVVDTSLAVKEVFAPASAADAAAGRGLDWAALMRALPADCRVAVLAGAAATGWQTPEEAARMVPQLMAAVAFTGADAQAANLEKAWDLCAAGENGAVLWLHGPLPVAIADVTGLVQRLQRRGGGAGLAGSPALVSLQALPGPNRIEEELNAGGGLLRLPACAGVGKSADAAAPEALQPHLLRVLAQAHYPQWNPLRLEIQTVPEDVAKRALPGSPHLARLAVAREIAARWQQANAGRGAAPDGLSLSNETGRACALRLVTPLSGAVVLESRAQYQQNELDPERSAKSVPTIPEPEEWALLLAAVVAFAGLLLWRRRLRGAVC